MAGSSTSGRTDARAGTRTWRGRVATAVTAALMATAGFAGGASATPAPAEAAAAPAPASQLRALRDGRTVMRAAAAATSSERGEHPAATVTTNDPAGDTTPINDCHPDITSSAGSYIDTTIGVGLHVSCGSNPTSDVSWTQGNTGILWGIEVNGDNTVDYDVFILNSGGIRSGVARDSDLTLLCNASPQWDGDATFTATFDTSCIGSPSSYRLVAFMEWDEAPTQSTCQCPVDVAPNSGFSATIAPGTPPPPPPEPTGYQTACGGADSAPGAFADAGLAADCLKAYGIALGKDDGTFGERDPLLRSQVSSLLVRLLANVGLPLTNHHTFPDVNATTVPNTQVRNEIELLAGSGVIAGFPDGTFGPAASLTVRQAATFLVRTLQLIHGQRPSSPAYADQGSTDANYDYALQRGLLDTAATNINGTTYEAARASTTARGLLADMLAQALEQLGNVFYADCAQASAAGAAPIQRGEPGYRPALDPDSDGTACN